MLEWFKLFLNKDSDKEITLTINGQTFKKSDCKLIDKGSEKRIFKIKNTNFCFFIPNAEKGIPTETTWNSRIKAEKYLLDEISNLGIKTQRFEIVPIDINKGETSYTINGLLTKDFVSLCEEESIMIYNRKASLSPQVIGKRPAINNLKELCKDKNYVQKMF
ncbi:MAG: hypothetical protein H0U73_00270 [Tatlockia sp.]|nr:hypothetical protein [Tatlockia sp.]